MVFHERKHAGVCKDIESKPAKKHQNRLTSQIRTSINQSYGLDIANLFFTKPILKLQIVVRCSIPMIVILARMINVADIVENIEA